ncbi:hypothetical protein OIV83_004681 [Microbotryomycetes sp. JL201]|nr:hypothetical protein OIV83_004681 [Microbotryomycetes sp. JL201]
MPTRTAPNSAAGAVKSPPLPDLPPPSPAPANARWPAKANVPSTWRDPPRHERRPSRAERYEHTVDSARNLLKRTTPHHSQGSVGLGIDAEPASCHQSTTARTQAELRDAVANLLKVIDGMSRQLATHDELAAQLKIAQSNLTLAETHSQFLEETLKRRDSRSSVQMVSRHSAGGSPLPSLPPSHSHTDSNRIANGRSRPSSSTSSYSNGKDLPPTADHGAAGGNSSSSSNNNNNSDARSSASAFFARLPSVRKPISSTLSTTSAGSAAESSSAKLPSHRAKRSSSSSPHRGSDSVRTRMSADLSAHPSPKDLSAKSPSELVQEVIALHHQVSSLEQSYYGLQSTNTSLRRSADKFATRCAELEKTKDDLMAELENLSIELFQEANTMVAEERKHRAQAESEVERLRAQVTQLKAELDHVRKTGALPQATDDGPRGSASGTTTTDTTRSEGTLRARDAAALNEAVASLPTPKPDTGTGLATRAVSPSVLVSPLSASSPTASPDPDTASLNSNSSTRKWFHFGRNLSKRIKGTASDDAETLQDFATVSPNPSNASSSLAPPRAPGMARVNSGSSVHSLSSVASSFFSAVSNEGHEGNGQHNASVSVEQLKDGLDAQTPVPKSSSIGQDGFLPESQAAVTTGTSGLTGGPRHVTTPPLHIETNNLSSKFPRSDSSSSQRGLVLVFSPDSSTGGPPSSSVDEMLRQETMMQERRSPRPGAMTFGSGDPTRGKPVAVRSFEGQGTAKSPKTPNERRWEKLAGQIPSATAATANALESVDGPFGSLDRTVPAVPLKTEGDDKRRPVALDLSNVSKGPYVNTIRSGIRRRSTDSAGSPVKGSSSLSAVPPGGSGRPTLGRAASSTSTMTLSSATPTTSSSHARSTAANYPLQPAAPASSNSNKYLQPLASPTDYVSPLTRVSTSPNGNGMKDSVSLMPASTSMTSLRSPTAVEDLEGLMKNIQDMSMSLFGDDQSQEWGLGGATSRKIGR